MIWNGGHCYVLLNQLVASALTLLNKIERCVDSTQIENALKRLAADGKIIIEAGAVYPPALYNTESSMAEKVKKLMEKNSTRVTRKKIEGFGRRSFHPTAVVFRSNFFKSNRKELKLIINESHIQETHDENLFPKITFEEIEWCEYCGRPGPVEEHHIKTSGSGGKDILINKIKLCRKCHDEAQQYKINRLVLVQIVALREGVASEEVCRETGIPVPDKFPELHSTEEEPGIEELIQAYISLKEQERDSKWVKAQLLAAMMDAGAKASWIASQIGTSASLIKKMVKTFKAFPAEVTRVPELSFEHHFTAATAKEPGKMIARAADEQMSTRELRKEIIKKEASEIIKAISSDEEEKDLEKAKRAFTKIEEMYAFGGPAKEWLKEQLKKLIA